MEALGTKGMLDDPSTRSSIDNCCFRGALIIHYVSEPSYRSIDCFAVC